MSTNPKLIIIIAFLVLVAFIFLLLPQKAESPKASVSGTNNSSTVPSKK